MCGPYLLRYYLTLDVVQWSSVLVACLRAPSYDNGCCHDDEWHVTCTRRASSIKFI